MVCGKEGFVRFDIDDDFNSILRKEKQYEKNNYDSHNYIIYYLLMYFRPFGAKNK